MYVVLTMILLCLPRLLDLGFEKDIESILEVLGSRDDKNRKRQHVLLSATLNERVEQLAALSLVKPATVGLEEAKQVEMAPARKVGNGGAGTQLESEKHDRNMGDAGPSDGYTEYRIPSQLVQSFLKGMLEHTILRDSLSSREAFTFSIPCVELRRMIVAVCLKVS
jgi:hypothetical protein